MHKLDTPNYSAASTVFLKAIHELAEPAIATRFTSHFNKLNTITGGLRPREFSIVCGATGTGKTTLLANLSADLIRQNVPHFVASVETGATDFVKRVLCALSGKDVNSGDAVAEGDLDNLYTNHSEKFKKDCMYLSLYEDRFSVETLINDLEFMYKTHGCKVAFIDNLNFFMEVTSASNAIVEMDRVIHNLIIFCKQVDMHIVMVMHPKKTDHGRVESEFDIKGSSTAVQESHNIFLFNRVKHDWVKNGYAKATDRELKIQKMRRRGQHVGATLILTGNSVAYREGDLFGVH